jgi:hypothetical protein
MFSQKKKKKKVFFWCQWYLQLHMPWGWSGRNQLPSVELLNEPSKATRAMGFLQKGKYAEVPFVTPWDKRMLSTAYAPDHKLEVLRKVDQVKIQWGDKDRLFWLRAFHNVLEVVPGLFHRLRPSVVQHADVGVNALAVGRVRVEKVVCAGDAQEDNDALLASAASSSDGAYVPQAYTPPPFIPAPPVAAPQAGARCTGT